MKIAVVGTGYVGLVTGTCFAEVGNEVVCVDIDAKKVAAMKRGQVPIYEPGLEDMFRRVIQQGRLSFTTSLAEGVADAEIIFLALPTPPGDDGSADLSYVLAVADQLGHLLKQYVVVVDKSTVPVGTAEKVAESIRAGTRASFDVVSNPEFLREGFAVDDFMHPDRVVVGVSSERAAKVMHKLYHPFIESDDQMITMDVRSAEMTKYAANSFLAMKISFMNEIANLCEALNANVDKVRLGIGSDSRIGSKFLLSGIGYGGSCFPKDVQALRKMADEQAYDFRILEAVMRVNQAQKERFLAKIRSHFGGSLRGKTIALWGLAFKPDTDDIRESAAVWLLREMISEGATVSTYDPEAMENVEKLLPSSQHLRYAADALSALDGADCLVVATEWPTFRDPNLEKVRKLLKQPVVFDGRNIYDPAAMQQAGFTYVSVGREAAGIDG